MDFYKDLEKDKNTEMAMKMVEFGAELMRPTATIRPEGAANATKVMMKGARERKEETTTQNKIAIVEFTRKK